MEFIDPEKITTEDPQFIVLSAMKLASMAHAGQHRKFSDDPYIVHPIAVAETVHRFGGTPEMMAAALLHDVLEDTDTPYAKIEEWTNNRVALMVNRLTDFDEGENRKERKANYHRQLVYAWPEVQTIKCADIMDNAPSIARNDPRFAVVYLQECMAAVNGMSRANPQIRSAAISMLELLQEL